MKYKWLLLVRDAAPWLWLLLLSDIFFIFMAWLASPDLFLLLIGLMIAFSLGCAAIGLLIAARKKRRQDTVFYLFLAEPSMKHEGELIDSCEPSLKKPIQDLGIFLREQQRLLAEYDHKSVEFEELIEAWIHEIKTPLSLATLLLDNRKEEMSDHVQKRFEYVRREISENVDRILYYARLQSAHIDYRFERISLSECCSEVLENLRSLFDEHDAVVRQDFDDIEVVSDMKALQFIISQILVNSIKYARPGTKPLVQLEAGKIDLQKQCFLKIIDNGMGVPEADLPFIFDKGFTGNYPNNRNATGMGLYLVKKFCDGMQIMIEVESQIAQGLSITLLFPVVSEV